MTKPQKSSLQLIGEKIRHFRKLKGLSQKDLAKKLNVTWETVSRWENGRVSALHKLTSIADILSVPVSYLLNIQDQPNTYGKQPTTSGIPYIGQLPQDINSLDSAYKKSLFSLQLEKFIPENSFAVKVSDYLDNQTSIPIDNNTILIINNNIQIQTNYSLYFNKNKQRFILAQKISNKNLTTVASIIAIILQ